MRSFGSLFFCAEKAVPNIKYPDGFVAYYNNIQKMYFMRMIPPDLIDIQRDIVILTTSHWYFLCKIDKSYVLNIVVK